MVLLMLLAGGLHCAATVTMESTEPRIGPRIGAICSDWLAEVQRSEVGPVPTMAAFANGFIPASRRRPHIQRQNESTATRRL